MPYFTYSLLILSPFLLLLSSIYRCERTPVIRFSAWVEYPDVYKCLLETTSPKIIHGNIKMDSIISDCKIMRHYLSCEWLEIWFDRHSKADPRE